MFDPQKVNENKEAFFLYVNASGELSAQSVIRVVERRICSRVFFESSWF